MRRPIAQRFASHAADDLQQRSMAIVRDQGRMYAETVARLAPEPESTQAIDLIEQAMFIANAGIARG